MDGEVLVDLAQNRDVVADRQILRRNAGGERNRRRDEHLGFYFESHADA